MASENETKNAEPELRPVIRQQLNLEGRRLQHQPADLKFILPGTVLRTKKVMPTAGWDEKSRALVAVFGDETDEAIWVKTGPNSFAELKYHCVDCAADAAFPEDHFTFEVLAIPVAGGWW